MNIPDPLRTLFHCPRFQFSIPRFLCYNTFMNTTSLFIMMAAGTAAFGAGVVFLLLELRRAGLGRFAFVSYLCFLAGIILLSEGALFAVIAGAGLTILYLFLFIFYKRNKNTP